MDLSWLADFLALNESRSFSRAAGRRHVTQPAFSRRIRALEQWAGATLFVRGPGSVTLTEPGQRFLPWAETLYRQVEEARADVRVGSQTAAAPLRIAATHSLSLTFVPRWIEAIGKRLSLGTAQLASDSLTGCERLLVAGEAQFLLTHTHAETPVRLEPAQFCSISVGSDALVPVASPRLAEQIGTCGLRPFVTYSSESGLGRILDTALARDLQIAALQPAFTSHHAGVLKEMARSGQGMAWLPRSIIGDEIERGTLILLSDPACVVDLDIRLFRPKGRLDTRGETFWTAAVEEAAHRADETGDGPTSPKSFALRGERQQE